MQTLDGLAIFSCERDVSTKVADRATRLQPTHHVSFRQMLVFQTYRCLDKDSSIFQHP
jgi:hypothetical protein